MSRFVSKFLLITGVVAVLVSSGPVHSRTELTGGRLPEWAKSSLNQKSPAMRLLFYAALCFQERYRPQALALLASERGSAEEDRIYGDLIRSSNRAISEGKEHLVCFRNLAASQPNVGTGTVRFASKGLLRGAIAEAFYNRQGIRPRGPEAVPLLDDWTAIAARWSAATNSDKRELVARWTAICAAHSSPQLVHRILRDNPGDVGETRALRALEPTFLRCLPQDKSLEVERLTMRALLAEGLWRASQANRAKFHNA